jgi:biopolymer transport protein ExbD
MASRFHRLRARQAEREPLTAHGNINLVPLVDILTSIVFFSLLTYTGAVMSMLTTFDLALPPVVVTPDQAPVGTNIDTVSLILAVGIKQGGVRVEHSGGSSEPFAQEIAGLGEQSLTELESLLTQIKTQYADNDRIMIVPDDNVSYEDIVHVLEKVKLAKFGKIALTSAARSMTAVNASAPGGR